MKKFSVLIITVVIFMNGCTSTKIKTYEGPEKSLREIALVKCNPFILVNAVDGNNAHKVYASGRRFMDVDNPKKSWLDALWYRDCEIGILPGRHTFDICFDQSYLAGNTYFVDRCKKDIRVLLDAQAGRIYRIKFQIELGGWRPWIEDVTEKERVQIEKERRKNGNGGFYP